VEKAKILRPASISRGIEIVDQLLVNLIVFFKRTDTISVVEDADRDILISGDQFLVK
jgi:hypothetical protein